MLSVLSVLIGLIGLIGLRVRWAWSCVTQTAGRSA
jgi:hypothetical protein